MIKNEPEDDIFREVRRIKEELAAAHDFDIGRMIEDSRRRQEESGRKILSPPPRRDSSPNR
ncbi:MAG: hypothetical protein HYV26_19200 [Candidatus Hydrogenedentes bacterium]|nr:hypothetical protein [Candidatus Hydrogenedentota bacterium]